MKLITFKYNLQESLGLLHNNSVLDLSLIGSKYFRTNFPTINLFLLHLQEFETTAQIIDKKFKSGDFIEYALPLEVIALLAPIPKPTSCRDGYAFRQHVEAARRNRGVAMIPEFDQYPIFYFTNHNAIYGPGRVPCMKDHFDKLDFELEAAVVLRERGRNIDASHADSYIFGYTIMNDISARTLQMEEMVLNLGPAKGKDFATSIGPYIITPDELEPLKIAAKRNHVGNSYNLKMKAFHNGTLVSEGNLADMDWTFAEIIERCSYGADVFAGDLIGSGTVGTGCYLELNGTRKLADASYVPQWIQPGDIISLEIDQLGKLENTFYLESDISLLAKKK